MVICLERDADLHMAQLMPLSLTVSCFNKVQIGFTFLVLAHPGSPGKMAIKRVCACAFVCVCVCVRVCVCVCVCVCLIVYNQFNFFQNRQCFSALPPLAERQEKPEKNRELWGVGIVICREQGADCLHMVQLMPLHPKSPPSLTSFRPTSRLVLPFWYWLTQVSLDKRPLNRCSSSSSYFTQKNKWIHFLQIMQHTYLLFRNYPQKYSQMLQLCVQ